MSFWQVAVVFLLVLINAFLAMSELAVVSSRKPRLSAMAEQKVRGAAKALKLADDPTGFLSTVQVGITLVGVLNGAYSGVTLSGPLAELLAGWGIAADYADTIAVVLVVILVTYVSIVIGELVPKRVAMSNAEPIAAFVAPIMVVIAKVAAPIVWFLRISTEGALTLLGIRRMAQSTVTQEEVRTMIAEGTESGVFHPAEREMLEGVIRVSDRTVRSIMVPRPDVVWIDIEDKPEATLREILGSGYSRFPASRGAVDEVEGVVHVKDLIDQLAKTGTIDIVKAMREPLFIDEHMPVLKLLERFKESAVHMAIVLDEHGSFEGVITPTDILTAIAGDLPDEHGSDDEPDATQRENGSWLLSGRLAIDEAERRLSVTGMNADGDFQTLAGFVLNRLGRIPEVGETFTWSGWRFEVVDLDARRIDKILATRIADTVA